MKINVIKTDKSASHNHKLMCFLLGMLEVKFKKVGYSVGKYMVVKGDPEPEHINIFVSKTQIIIFRVTEWKQPCVCNYHESQAKSVFEVCKDLAEPIRSTSMLIEVMRSTGGSSLVELAETVKQNVDSSW